jgi:hypothetical protein
MCNAFLAGLASARDLAHRSSPVEPRIFFRRGFCAHLRWWPFVWLLTTFLILAWWSTRALWSEVPLRIGLNTGSVLVLDTVAFSFFVTAGCFVFAPFCPNSWSLAALVISAALIAHTVMSHTAVHAFLGNSTRISILVTSLNGTVYLVQSPFFQLWTVLVAGLTALSAWIWARRRGDRWFRFEE